MKRIAIMGAGIAGLSAAYVLARRHQVWLFEKEARLGGHTNTVVAGNIPLDTGFLVHNDRTSPNLVRLFREFDVATQASDMCFAVTCRRTGLEYSSRGARGFFAQRSNVLRPNHYRLLREILRFNREAPALLSQDGAENSTLGDVLDAQRTRRTSVVSLSIRWRRPSGPRRSTRSRRSRPPPSSGSSTITDCSPWLEPQWKTVVGGSRTYVDRITSAPDRRLQVVSPASIRGVARCETHATMTFLDRPDMTFDEVIFACHGDEVLTLLVDPSDRERDLFSGFRTTTNTTCLHTDARMLPVRPDARASWNYLLPADADAPRTVTYHLNRLQRIGGPVQYCVTLNPGGRIDSAAVLQTMVYTHPLYTRDAIRAQSRWAEVSGVNRTHYAGAYWAYGFHEDGLNSGLRVARGRLVTSGVYVGTLRHRRFAPVMHAFRYPLFMVLLDVDRIDALIGVSSFTSRNRFNWATFDDRDHFGDARLALRERVQQDAAAHGIELPATGRIFLLTHLRYLGFCFNPVSFFYCCGAAGGLQYVLSEVNNTFGGSRNYWTRPHDASGRPSTSRRSSSPTSSTHSISCGPATRWWRASQRRGAARPPVLRRDALARAAGLVRCRHPTAVRAPSADDRERHRRHPLAGAQAVAEGRACRAENRNRRTEKRR